MRNEISIQRITQDNIRACAKLEPTDDQKQYIATNLGTIAWAYVDPKFTPYAICDGDTVIGVCAVEDISENESYDRYWVPRFMIGKQFQGKGYGKMAMEKIIEMLSEKENCERIRLSVVPENEGAILFYKKVGFEETDEMLEDERVMDFFVK